MMKTHALFFSLTGKRWERSLWVHRVATFLRLQDWDAEVIDFTSFWKIEELKELVRSRVNNKTVMFCFGTVLLNPWSPYLNEFINWLKKEYPEIATVIGGQNALVTKADSIDYWVDSYGENAILTLAKHLTGNLSIPLKHEVINGKIVIRGIQHYPSTNLDTYLIDFETRDFIKSYESPQMETARGCMFNCLYCNFPLIGQTKDVSISKEEFKKHIQINYDKWGIKNWRIMDETVNDRPEKIRKYAEAMDELGYNSWFSGFARGDLVVKHKQYWDDYIRMGFLGHAMGVETFNKEAGKLVRKGMDPTELQAGLLDFQTYTDKNAPRRYRANIQMICGIPGETVESWYDSMKWLNTHWVRQSASAWILEVSDYDESLSNQSLFTRELKKYGLKKIDSREHPGYYVHKDQNNNTVIKSINAGGVGTTRNNVIIWQHDYMNWYQAEKLVEEFYGKNGYIGRLGGNPFLSDRLFVYHQATDFEQIYDYNISDVSSTDEVFLKFVQNYIDNKLNWK